MRSLKLVLFTCKFWFIVNRTTLHMKVFALGFALKQRGNVTRKSPVTWCVSTSFPGSFLSPTRERKEPGNEVGCVFRYHVLANNLQTCTSVSNVLVYEVHVCS